MTSYPYRRISHFEGLNGLRFIAAFLVVMHHSETIRRKYGLPHLEDYALFRNGSSAVSFFFVLSGFLITYLLLKEQSTTSTISIRRFYVRRILRIWPLYFLLVAVGTLLVPFAVRVVGYDYQTPYTFGQVWFYFLFFVPFMVNILFGHHIIEPLWSIGVEELFYLFWAPFSKFVQQYYVPCIVTIIAVKAALTALCLTVLREYVVLSRCIEMLQFDAMAIGALGACWVFNREKDLTENILFGRPFQVLAIALLVAKLGFHDFLSTSPVTSNFYNRIFDAPVLSSLLLYALFLWLVLNVSLNRNRIISLESNTLNLLGDISYGIYMYHMPLIAVLILAGKSFLLKFEAFSGSLIYYPIIGSAVILTSYVSKKVLEDYFLGLKQKFI